MIHWWNLVLRGLFGILFGLLALFWPGITLIALVILYGTYALADGILALYEGFHRDVRRGPLVLEGIFGIAAWALVPGIMEVIGAFRVRDHGVWLGLSGVASVAFGVLLFGFPSSGAL